MKNNLKKSIEVLVFASDKPISAEQIARFLEIDNSQNIDKLIEKLNLEYSEQGRTFCIRKVAGGYKFATDRQYYHLIEKLYEEKKDISLTSSALEVLAIVAYHQPITRPKVDAIRGVNSQYHIKNLLEVKLVKIAGRMKTFGRPLLYTTTDKFLEFFGLNDIEDLPNLHQIRELMATDIAEPQNMKTKDQLELLAENSDE
ncbi:MAG: SMC-Scp complex subunit ScpB [Candidatus Cloacimonas sp. 4484_140]|nr:MAG: SMC-Scp complex subunit ScpB [Candidatus Cloacimonas sp. 4484_140]